MRKDPADGTEKRILFVLPEFGIGGAEKSLLTLINALLKVPEISIDILLFKKRGAFLHLIPQKVRVLETEHSLQLAYSPFSLSEIHSASDLRVAITRLFGTFVTTVLAGNKRKKKQTRWTYFYKSVIREYPDEYDYACGYLDGEANYYVIDKVRAKKKYIWNQNDYSKIGSDRKYDLPYYTKADKIITLSDTNYEILQRFFPEQMDKVEIIPPIVTPEFIMECAEQYDPPEYESAHGHILSSVGRLIDQKGFDIAIDAAAILKRKGVDFSWYIIGNGIRHDALEDQIRNNGLENSVFLIGERENPYPYIKNSEMFIQPSRYEAKTVILTETKMLCRPIVVTAFETAKDQITDGINGKIVEMNCEALAEGIESLLDSAEADRYIENLKKEVESYPSSLQQNLKLFGVSELTD